MFQPITISGITELTKFNEKYGLLDVIGDSSIGSNKTGSRRIDKTHPTKKILNISYNYKYVLLNFKNLERKVHPSGLLST